MRHGDDPQDPRRHELDSHEYEFPGRRLGLALASAPSAAFKSYLAAVEFRAFDPKACPNDPVPSPAWTPFKPFVSRTDDGGMTWTTVTGLPNTWELPSSVAFDPYDKNRSYVTYRNYGARMYMSTGGAYSKIAGTFPTELPTDVRHVVVDPFDTNVLYAATRVGMFRGEVTLGSGGALPTAKWVPFDEGLPDGMEINDLWIDPANGILTIGSFGFGAFRRDIREKTKCDARMLVVRDCVNDDGRQPSPCGDPDPEHPIPVGNQGFYQPDDSYAGSAQWFASRDIRIDVPSKNPPANKIEVADSVEFEICPTAISNCPPQSMIDSAPIGLEEARVYVQVTNRGVEPVNKTRVIALWAPSAAAFDSLPETFWTKTFPADGNCGPLDPTTAWQLVDPITPCRTIATVTPEMPELARFKWIVPFAAHGGATMLTVIESPEDKLDSSIRDKNKLWPVDIVPGSRHIALRNLRIQGIKIREIEIPKMWPLDLLKLPYEMSEVEVVRLQPRSPRARAPRAAGRPHRTGGIRKRPADARHRGRARAPAPGHAPGSRQRLGAERRRGLTVRRPRARPARHHRGHRHAGGHRRHIAGLDRGTLARQDRRRKRDDAAAGDVGRRGPEKGRPLISSAPSAESPSDLCSASAGAHRLARGGRGRRL